MATKFQQNTSRALDKKAPKVWKFFWKNIAKACKILAAFRLQQTI